MLAPDTLLQNRYRIVGLLARGGMGAVYEARDQRLKNTVAVKETFFADEHLLKAFEREARMLAGLRHRSLPKVSDHFAEDGGQFLVMEFVPGDDLGRTLEQQKGPFPFRQVLPWADQLLSVLEYLHRQTPPIIHRDIKPANLKLSARGDLVLLDFGLAKGARTTAYAGKDKSVAAFTPGYAPLEQIRGEGSDPRGDLYAFGATFYHFVTGQPPPDAVSRAMEIVSGGRDPLRPAHEIVRTIPPEVSDVLRRVLALNRDDRPSSATEVRHALLRAVGKTSSETPVYSESARTASVSAPAIEELPQTLIQNTSEAGSPVPDTQAPTRIVSESPAQFPPTPAAKPMSEPSSPLRIGIAVASVVVLLVVMLGVFVLLAWNSRQAPTERPSDKTTPAKRP